MTDTSSRAEIIEECAKAIDDLEESLIQKASPSFPNRGFLLQQAAGCRLASAAVRALSVPLPSSVDPDGVRSEDGT